MYSAKLPNLFLDSKYSDVQLRIESSADDREVLVPAHRLVLSCASQVFRAMLDTSHFKEGRTGKVSIKVKGDVNDAIYFLRYLYTRELEYLDITVHTSLLHTAHLYDVKGLVKICAERIVDELTPFNVCKTYMSLRNLESKDFLENLESLMLEFAFLIFRKDLHLTLDEEGIKFLLSSDELNVLDEEQALGALWRWGCAHRVLAVQPSNEVREVVARILPLIRKDCIEDVSEDSPWFDTWNHLFTLTETDKSEISPDSLRKPKSITNLSRFAEVSCLSRKGTQYSNVKPAEAKTHARYSVMQFSVNLGILLSGFTIQVTTYEKLTCQYKFYVLVNEEKFYREASDDIVLLSDHTALRSDMSSYHIYIYDIKFNFQTPLFIREAEFNRFRVDIIPTPKFGFYFTCNDVTENSPLDFNRNLKFNNLSKTIAVKKLYYYI